MVERDQLTDDLGVAVEGYICQNFAEHPHEEFEMESGPFVGVICPECGRVAGGGPPLDAPYLDPKHGAVDEAGTAVALPDDTWDVVVHGLEEELAQLVPEEEWIGMYPEEQAVEAMEEAIREIMHAIRDGDGDE